MNNNLDEYEVGGDNNVYPHPSSRRPPLETGGGGGNDDTMDTRVSKLEAIIPTLATKADVEGVRTDIHKVSSEMKGWFIATAVLVLVGLFTIANIMISNVRSLGDRPSPSAQQPAPIVIQLPAQQQPAPPLVQPVEQP